MKKNNPFKILFAVLTCFPSHFFILNFHMLAFKQEKRYYTFYLRKIFLKNVQVAFLSFFFSFFFGLKILKKRKCKGMPLHRAS